MFILRLSIDNETLSQLFSGNWPGAYQSNEGVVMRTLILSAFLGVATLTSMAADNVSLTGKWKIHQSVAGNDSDSDCTFTQKDNDLTGTCTADQGSGKITGKIDGNKVSWSYESEYNGSPLTVKYSGTVDSTGKIAGSLSVEQFGVDGDFTATPVQDKN
jgi:hypothetical protein